MTTDKTPATLAAAKHGGCVQLGTSTSRVDADTLWWLQDAANTLAEGGNESHAAKLHELHAALSAQPAQPAPGGQEWPFVESPGEFTARLHAAMREFDLLGAVRHVLIEKPAALAARQPVGENPAWRDELVLEAYNRGLADGLNADRQPVVWSVLQIGNSGAIYDPKDARRAFEIAWRLGEAARLAMHSARGDCIDRGLLLLKGLQNSGFGVFQIGEYTAAPAQAVDLGQLPHGIRLIEIPGRNNLDPINVFVQDYELGRGRIVVTCYGQAWCGFWGAMGDRTVMQFVAACDADYVAGNMLSGRHEHVRKHERAYVERIATEVIAEFRSLIGSQAVGNG